MGSERERQDDANTYLCEKTGQRVPRSEPVCPKPEEACKYRVNCIIYALYEDHLYSVSRPGSRIQHKVTYLPEQRSALVGNGESLLDAARRAGVPIASACGGDGTCGKCKVVVRKGDARCSPDQHLAEEDRRAGYVLACQCRPLEDLVVEIAPEARNGNVQALGDEGSIIAFEVGSEEQSMLSPLEPADLDPLVKPVQVIVEPPSLEDPTADLERVCQQVSQKIGATCYAASLSTLRQLPSLLRTYDWKATVYAQSRDGYSYAIKAAPPGEQSNQGLAIDIGTTTVVVQLIDLEWGRIVGTRGSLNRQAAYGEDVITRIIHACQNQQGLKTLHDTIINTINSLIGELCDAYGLVATDMHCAVCAGNSTMIHLVLGIAPCTIRREPFVSVTNFPSPLRANEIGLDILPEAPVTFVPGISGYVGGDITAGTLASGLYGEEEPCVLIDVGTNGEIVLGNRDWLICCASSAGPAFEGGGLRCGMRAATGAIQRLWIDDATGEPRVATIDDAPARGICGSGLIDAIAELMRAGFIDRTGKFTESAPAHLLRETEEGKALRLVPREEANLADDILITETDITHAIRSKGAIFTAIYVLMEKVGMSFQDVARFYVAGGFGNYLNLRNAVTIGLLPDLPEERFRFVGNAALQGAKMALSAKVHMEQLTSIARMMTYVELSAEPLFMDRYVASLFLPHTDETLFPSVVAELWGTALNQGGRP